MRRTFFACCMLFVLVSLTQTALSQCEQEPPDCDCDYTVQEFKICIGGTSYTGQLEICTQTPKTHLIDNPCTVQPNPCDRAINSIIWVRRICVDQALKNMGMLAIYNAVIAGTNLCCNNFIGAAIPNCSAGTTCKTSPNAYCHLLMLPKCTTKNFINGCYEYCGNGCDDFCVVERRYCMMTPTTCCMEFIGVCEYNSDDKCTQNCTTPFDQCEYLVGSSVGCCS